MDVYLSIGGHRIHLDVLLGTVTATSNFKSYSFEIPLELAATLATSEEAEHLRLESSIWNPGEVLGVNDDRDVGVMVDRITLEE